MPPLVPVRSTGTKAEVFCLWILVPVGFERPIPLSNRDQSPSPYPCILCNERSNCCDVSPPVVVGGETTATELVLGRQPTALARNVSVVVRGGRKLLLAPPLTPVWIRWTTYDGDRRWRPAGESHETSSLTVTKQAVNTSVILNGLNGPFKRV
jgi:hypothetical protein